MSRSVSMGRAAKGSDPIDAINALAARIEQQLRTVPTGRAYTVTANTEQRTLAVSTAAAPDVAKVLGTLIGDLQAGGLIG